MKVKIKIFDDKLNVIPQIQTAGAGAMDVVASEVNHYHPLKVEYKLGFGVELPSGYRLMVQPRGSFTKTDWVMQNGPGLVDEDFRGNITMKFHYVGKRDIGSVVPPFEAGDRIGQCYIEAVIPVEWEVTEELTKTERGEGAYGSTNSK